MSTPAPAPALERHNGRHRTLVRAGAVAAATLAAVLVYIIADPLAGQDLLVAQPDKDPEEVGLAMVVFSALASSLAGWALLAVLERFAAARARIIWTVVASVVLVLSFIPLLGIEAEGGTKAALALMHVVVGGILIAALPRR